MGLDSVMKDGAELAHVFSIDDYNMYHYAPLVPVAPPNSSFPSSTDIGLGGGSFNALHKFYFDFKFWFCEPLPSTNPCKTWDLNTGEIVTQVSGILHTDALANSPTSVETNGVMWMTGGVGGNGVETDKTAILHQDGTWTAGPDLPFTSRLHQLVPISEKLVLYFGGYHGGARFTCHTFDVVAGTSEQKATHGLAKFGTAAGKIKLLDGQDVVLACGWEISIHCEVYYIKSDRWEHRTDFEMPKMRAYATTFVVNNRMFLFRGVTQHYAGIDELWEFKEGRKPKPWINHGVVSLPHYLIPVVLTY